ncbi:heterokaryon incompatibility protein-domain-containing protein [Cadophora sp. MPI-SDFR-AT-0126]|nr:heterokaryon incompatibility protein-domain-containing protein [Leotiomycetes sp. MPI-SDFR-AT-0126]
MPRSHSKTARKAIKSGGQVVLQTRKKTQPATEEYTSSGDQSGDQSNDQSDDHYYSGESQPACPVCAKLPLDGPPLGFQTPPFEYDLDHDYTEFQKYKGSCSLHRLLRDLHGLWLENRTYPSRRNYSYVCGPHGSRLVMATNPRSWDVLSGLLDTVMHPNPLHPSTIARLQTWIQRCDQEHEACRGEKLPAMPTRVLDLSDLGSDGIVKLVETNGSRGQYIALSHCWGTSNTFLTTRDTIQQMKDGFNPSQAPATFRDAIMLTQKLQIRYLWIDSLCIIQRDTEDWNIEASRMGDVYRHSYLMIAAASAAGDSEGFLNLRPKVQCWMKVNGPQGRSVNLYLRPESSQYQWPQPLDSRGWTLQETYLCQRRLFLQRTEISWYCQSAYQREAFRDVEKQPLYCPKTSVTNLRPTITSPNSNPYPYYNWYKMIEGFSTRKLSFLSDRLPALSGLATLVAAQRDGRYCAGLWWEDIGYSICWSAEMQSSIRSNRYIAPSWSWASFIGSVTFPSLEITVFRAPKTLDSVAFHDCQVIPRGSNTFGELKFGWLELEAPLASLFKTPAAAFHEFRRDLDRNYFSIQDTGRENLDVKFDVTGDSRDDLCALFMTEQYETLGSASSVFLGGIVLRRAPNQEEVVTTYNLPKGIELFQRVGVFTFAIEIVEREKFFKMVPQTKVLLL